MNTGKYIELEIAADQEVKVDELEFLKQLGKYKSGRES